MNIDYIQDKINNASLGVTAKVVMKDKSDLSDVTPKLLEAGYDPRNIHLVWILTDYKVASKANKERDRVVPEDILFMSHQKAAQNMLQRIKTMRGFPYIPSPDLAKNFLVSDFFLPLVDEVLYY